MMISLFRPSPIGRHDGHEQQVANDCDWRAQMIPKRSKAELTLLSFHQ